MKGSDFFKKGTTLIELIIYISVITVVLMIVLNFAWRIIFDQVSSQNQRELHQNARLAMEKMERVIKRASGINYPYMGETGEYLSLSMEDPEKDPTLVNLSEGQVVLEQGSQGPASLTNSRVEVENLQFSNFSYSDTPGLVKIEMELKISDAGEMKPYQASFGAQSSVALNPGGVPPSPPGSCEGEAEVCGSFGDSTSCGNQDGCQWHSGNCEGICTPCGELGFFYCLFYQDGCSWAWFGGGCQGECVECQNFGTQDDCNGQLGCSWENAYCFGEAVSCASYTTEVSCNSQEGCSWVTQ